MKTFKEIMKEIDSTYDLIDKSKEQEKALTFHWSKEYDKAENLENMRKTEKALSEAAANTRYLYMQVKILAHNARVALYHEALPVVLQVLAKYKGKAYGEKTRAKITAEIDALTGYRVYISTRYNQDEINIYPNWGYGNTYSITCGLKPDYDNRETNRILIDNKIQAVSIENFSLWYEHDNYIEDIPGAIAQMIELHGKALAIQKELETVCSAFNKLAVNGIKHIYKDKYIMNGVEFE